MVSEVSERDVSPTNPGILIYELGQEHDDGLVKIKAAAEQDIV